MFVFSYHNSLSTNAGFLTIYPEFQRYKEGSADDEHAAPTHNIQKKYVGISPLFGRDRFEKFNKLAHIEEIQHLHVRQENSIWENEEGHLFQWYCTSDASLVYSYFLHDQKHHYFVIEFYQHTAHKEYEHAVEYFIDQAKQYRLSVITPRPNSTT